MTVNFTGSVPIALRVLKPLAFETSGGIRVSSKNMRKSRIPKRHKPKHF